MDPLLLMGLPMLYATFVLGYVVSAGIESRNHHLRTFMTVYILFCVDKSVTVAEWLLQRAGLDSPGISLAIRMVDEAAVFVMFLLLLHFVRSFYGVVSFRLAAISLVCYLADWAVRLIGALVSPSGEDSWLVLLQNISVVPLLLWILLLGFRGYRMIRSAQMRRMFLLAMLITASVGFIILVDGLLETFTSIDLPKDPVMVLVYATLVLVYLGRFRSYLSSFRADPVETFGDEYSLTGREREIVSLLLKGHSYAEIGDLLYISLATVKTHTHNIYAKTGLSSRFELMNVIRETAD